MTFMTVGDLKATRAFLSDLLDDPKASVEEIAEVKHALVSGTLPF